MLKFCFRLSFLLLICLTPGCSEDERADSREFISAPVISVDDHVLDPVNAGTNTAIPLYTPIKIKFATEIDILSANSSIELYHIDGTAIPFTLTFDEANTALLVNSENLVSNQTYFIEVNNQLKGADGQLFEGILVQFTTGSAPLVVTSLKINGTEYLTASLIKDIPQNPSIEITFSFPVNPSTITPSSVTIAQRGSVPLTFTYADNNKKLIITPTQPLAHLARHQLTLSGSIKGANGETSSPVFKNFYTVLDPTPKKTLLPNDEDSDNNNDNDLLSVVQKQTFKYFYDFAEPTSGMARERNTSGTLVTSGGSGFGIMALIVGMERNFITQQQGLDRMNKIVTFLENADRFHGAWSHWINGTNGNVIPFSANDNGGDLVETAFLVEGLITFRQYLVTESIADTYDLVNRINLLWEGVEWDWYRRSDQNVLYWHWSPNLNWVMNHQIQGWNECMITYVLAASSPTHSIPKSVYTNGWARNGAIRNGNMYEGITLPLGFAYGGPLFFTHYSFVGMSPKGEFLNDGINLNDEYADYWIQNVNHTLINYKYCVRNPRNYIGYSDECWGLTASDNHQGYSAHSPTNDLGVITPTAALSSFPYTPVESMKALKFFYYKMGDRLWGDYGFYDAFNVTQDWYANSYLAIDQGPIIVMIENYRTGLLWNLFMSAPEIQAGLVKLDIGY